jgi:hypothetical protein
MSDPVDETPEGFSSPGPNIAKEQTVIRIGAYDYLFERTPDGTLIYESRFPVAVADDDEPEPFDPLEYR